MTQSDTIYVIFKLHKLNIQPYILYLLDIIKFPHHQCGILFRCSRHFECREWANVWGRKRGSLDTQKMCYILDTTSSMGAIWHTFWHHYCLPFWQDTGYPFWHKMSQLWHNTGYIYLLTQYGLHFDTMGYNVHVPFDTIWASFWHNKGYIPFDTIMGYMYLLTQ